MSIEMIKNKYVHAINDTKPMSLAKPGKNAIASIRMKLSCYFCMCKTIEHTEETRPFHPDKRRSNSIFSGFVTDNHVNTVKVKWFLYSY